MSSNLYQPSADFVKNANVSGMAAYEDLRLVEYLKQLPQADSSRLAVLGFSIYEMILRSTKMMYDGPMEALLGVFDLVIYYGKMMGSPEFIATLLIGGVLGGIAAEWAGRRWS